VSHFMLTSAPARRKPSKVDCFIISDEERSARCATAFSVPCVEEEEQLLAVVSPACGDTRDARGEHACEHAEH
jgi:hypothetical protein